MEFEFRFVLDELSAVEEIIPGSSCRIVAHELPEAGRLRLLTLREAMAEGQTNHIYHRDDIPRVPWLKIAEKHKPDRYFYVVNDLMKPDHINIFAHTRHELALPRLALSLADKFSIDETHVTEKPTKEFRALFDAVRRRLRAMGKAVRYRDVEVVCSSNAIAAVRSGTKSTGDDEVDKKIAAAL
jgi:hypothetical protein